MVKARIAPAVREDERELIAKVRELSTGLRGALKAYDADTSHPISDTPCDCDLCAAFASLRSYVRDLELAVADLERAYEGASNADGSEKADG
jgi:hypothetical protein